MTPLHYDAIVVGAGPAGSTAAIRLAQAGWSVALVEQERFPRRKVCGECIAASNLPLLAALGVAQSFDALAGPPLRRIALLVGRETICAPLPPASQSPQPWGRALAREHLDSLLLARARALGVTVWQPYVARHLRGGPGAYHCELRAPRASSAASALALTLRAPVAIEASGWQPLGADPGAPAPTRRASDLLAFKANFLGARLAPDLLPVLAFPGGYGGMVLAGDGVLTLACCIQRASLQQARRAAPGRRAGEAVQAYLRRHCQGVADVLDGAERRDDWLAVGPIRPGRLPSARAYAARSPPPPFRVGNAAGEVHPLIGEGISMALQSAWLLCALLVDCPQARSHGAAALSAQRALQGRYTAQWRAQFLGRMRLAACLAQLAMRPQRARALLALLRRAPGLLTQGARWSGKIRTVRTGRQEMAA